MLSEATGFLAQLVFDFRKCGCVFVCFTSPKEPSVFSYYSLNWGVEEIEMFLLLIRRNFLPLHLPQEIAKHSAFPIVCNFLMRF